MSHQHNKHSKNHSKLYYIFRSLIESPELLERRIRGANIARLVSLGFFIASMAMYIFYPSLQLMSLYYLILFGILSLSAQINYVLFVLIQVLTKHSEKK